MHHRQLPRVIELKTGDALSVGQGGGRSQAPYREEKGLEVMLPVEVAHPSGLMYLVEPVFHLTRKLGWPEMP